MGYLFEKDIYNWNSWGEVYQSIPDFRSLIESIFIKEKLLGCENISCLTPGSNAVFKTGNNVIKIFAPKESGVDTEKDYFTEIDSIKRAIMVGIETPRIISSSNIQDKYMFRYIIMDYIEGKEAGNIIKTYSRNQKAEFVKKLKANLSKYNQMPTEIVNDSLLKNRAINNKKWYKFSDNVRSQIVEILKDHTLSSLVYVHGDITADNVIVDNNENLHIIDFADSTIAPFEYEYPPIIFDLFNFDKELIFEFIKDIDYDVFIEKLFIGTLLHDFGADFISIIYNKYTGKDVCELSNIHDIKTLLYPKFLL